MPEQRQNGSAMVLVVVLGLVLMVLTAVSLQMSQAHATTIQGQRALFSATQIASSGASQALAQIKEGGVSEPISGTGVTAEWVSFGNGDFLYYTTFDATNRASSIRAWGRVPVATSPSSSSVPPDDVGWDGTGWQVYGMEVSVLNIKYLPQAPMYFGNGGIERPMGGFEWGAGVDPTDPNTWVPITSSPDSTQTATSPFAPSALDHPFDYLYNGGTPAAAGSPHPFPIWPSQNAIGQYNVAGWFAESAGVGNDPTINVTPPIQSPYYDTSDSSSPDYPYPVDANIADVQTFAFELWNDHNGSGNEIHLGSGSQSGTYGDLLNPRVTFVTGELRVDAATTFEGAGILVIRDDYDPNVDTDNQPAIRAKLTVAGTFRWTGLVVVSGWAPSVTIQSGGDATILGSLFGEDSVQSGGEMSLDSATISLNIQDSLRVLYSSSLFAAGGLIYDFMPEVGKRIVGVREL